MPAADVHGALDGVFQFADVAGPRVPVEQVPRFGIDGLHALAERRRKLVQEMVRQKFHVAAPGGKGRDAQEKRIQPVIQVMPEHILPHGFFQIAVCRGDDADIDPPGALSAHAGDLAVLQQPQQADLRLERHFPYLVKKDGAAVGQFEFAGFSLTARARERALVIAEQLRLHEIAGQGAAVDHDERLVGAAARVVYGLGEQFLARAGFADDERRDVAVRRELALPDRLLEQIRFADDPIERIRRLGAQCPRRQLAHPFPFPQRENHSFLRRRRGGDQA